MDGVELEKYAIDHEMSNQQSEKQSLETQHSAGLFLETWSLPTTLQFHCFSLRKLWYIHLWEQ